MKPVLVAHASVYGSTREVAEAVAKSLTERGIETDLRPAAEVDGVEGYSAVVLGGALYYFRWHKDARKFLSRHKAGLAAMPVAVFAMGPFNDTDEEYQGARQQLDKALAKQRWLTPVAKEVFGGCFQPDKLRFPHGNPAMKKIPPSDIRDWQAIGEWADSLPVALGIGQAPAGSPE